jgi:hypothetical protein
MFKYSISPLLESVDDYFRIGVRLKDMAMTFELVPQFLKIVDFAVKNHPDRTVGMPHGLVAAG